MAGDDAKIVGNQDRLVEAEALDRLCDLLDLLLRVRAGVAGIGPQSLRRDVLDLQRTHLQRPRLSAGHFCQAPLNGMVYRR
jgi:hypothetical protein